MAGSAMLKIQLALTLKCKMINNKRLNTNIKLKNHKTTLILKIRMPIAFTVALRKSG